LKKQMECIETVRKSRQLCLSSKLDWLKYLSYDI
jgi:hypothetical protein